jgi:hypothetical protein
MYGDTEANVKIICLKACDSDSDFMQFQCECTTPPTTGQTSCVCTKSGDEVHTNVYFLASASSADSINGSISIDLEQFMFRGTIFG